MDRHGHRIGTWRAWLLFVLALVAVAAPVWSDLYVCPMERAEKAVSPRCCEKAEAAAATRTDLPSYQVPCDCAKLDWPSQAIDNAIRYDAVPGQAALAPSPRIVPALGRAETVASARPPGRAERSGPPLWVVNLSIRC